MHPAPAFRWDDRAALLSFVGARSFGTLVDASLRVSQVPVIVDGPDRLLLHLSRGNPMARGMPLRVVAVFAGVDGYVSPDWYVTPDQVPTWNYESVEITGTLAPTDDRALRDILARLGAEHESRIAGKRPWTMDKLTPATLDSLARGIVGATLSIESVRGTQKLSQNKAPADRDGVIAALDASATAANREVASRMRRVGG
jgi:transcriptional regulator